MDEKGIIACSEAEYYVHNFSSSQDRKSTPALQSIFRQNDPNIVTCLTTIVPVSVEKWIEMHKKRKQKI